MKASSPRSRGWSHERGPADGRAGVVPALAGWSLLTLIRRPPAAVVPALAGVVPPGPSG